jgi:polyribonucleotide nucleotidyltransferase
VHVSELANFRVKKVEDIVRLGDEITVKCVGVDEKGRVRLSRKAASEEREAQESGSAPAETAAPAAEAPASEPAPGEAPQA